MAINLLKESGVKVFAFTNQHRISRGEATEEDFMKQFEEYGFDQSYICPHEEEMNCNCRKPKPGLLLQSAKEHHLDLNQCIVIGDVGSTDMLAAHAVGAMKIFVKTGWGLISMTRYRDTWKETEPDFVAEDILDAVNWILKKFFR
jgi:histidinol-phosphate phosphatase family protein